MRTSTFKVRWLGLTPKEHSSGQTRRIGRISKRGDRYLRMLLTHGSRSVLNAAALAIRMQRPIDPLRHWALQIQQRSNHNKAVCALANKLASICYAVLRDHEPYGAARLEHKLQRRASQCQLDRIEPTSTLAQETHRPSWLTGPRPHRLMPITTLAARLPFAAIGTAVLQISISARDTQLPLKMPDIRLQANSCSPNDRSVSTCGGSPYTKC